MWTNSEPNLPKWISVIKQRFDVIKSKVQNAKKTIIYWPDQKRVKLLILTYQNKLLHEIENSQITYGEALKRIENIRSDINKLISMQSLNLNQINLLNILFKVDEIFTWKGESVGVNEKGNFEIFKEKSNKEKQKSDEKPNTTDITELESEKKNSTRTRTKNTNTRSNA